MYDKNSEHCTVKENLTFEGISVAWSWAAEDGSAVWLDWCCWQQGNLPNPWRCQAKQMDSRWRSQR